VRSSHHVGCCPYAQVVTGSSAPAPGQPAGPVAAGPVPAGLVALVSHLYACEGLSTYEIAEAVGISRRRIRGQR
jgi:hypothetical protein